MQIKVGDQTFDSKQQPIMVILTEKDKNTIAGMQLGCEKYAEFDEECWTPDEMREWMKG